MRDLVFVLVSLNACVRPSPEPSPKDGRFESCWAITLGPWQAPLPGWPTEFAPPAIVELTRIPAPRVTGYYLVLPALGQPRTTFQATWGEKAPDTLTLAFGNGLSGVSIAVGGEPPDLRGRAMAWTDGGAMVEGIAHLSAASCIDHDSLERWVRSRTDTTD